MRTASTLAVMSAALLSCVCFMPVAAGAAQAAPAAKTASEKTNPVIAQLVTLHLGRLAMKQITAIETADQITADARAYVKQYGPAEAKELHDNLSLVASVYVESVEHTARRSTTWPADKSKEMAQAALDVLNAELQRPGVDYLSIMRRANDVLAWTKGKPHATGDIDHFGRHDVLVAYALARVPEAAKLVEPPAAAVVDAGAAAAGSGSDSTSAPATAIGTADSAVKYTCETGLGVTAFYSEGQDTSEAKLEIAGKTYALTSSISASGAKYTSPVGKSAGKSLTWWTKGEEAMLIEAPPGGEDGPNATIVKCKEAAGASADAGDDASSEQRPKNEPPPATGVAPNSGDVQGPKSDAASALDEPGAEASADMGPVRYSCENGLGVIATYSETNDASEVKLTIGEKSFTLPSAMAASGAKYSSPTGMSAGKTMSWWTKGSEAMLIEAPPGGEGGPNETIVNCADTVPQAAGAGEGEEAPAPGGSAGQIQKLTVTSSDPKAVITGLFRDGAPAQTEGLGTAKVVASFVMDEDGIPCDSEGYEVRLANGVIYRPAINLCEAKWTLSVPAARPAMPSPLPEPLADLVWRKYPEETGKPPAPDSPEEGQDETNDAYLAFAIPETDAFAMYGKCQKGIGRAVASFPSGEGDKPTLEILLADRTLVYGFKPIDANSVSEEGGPLYELDLPVSDQLWRSLRAGTRLPYRIGNSQFMMLDASKGVDAINQFLTACEGE